MVIGYGALKEACIFAEFVGNQKIDFIEEPINDVTQLDAFYQQTRMRVALDETLAWSTAASGHLDAVPRL